MKGKQRTTSKKFSDEVSKVFEEKKATDPIGFSTREASFADIQGLLEEANARMETAAPEAEKTQDDALAVVEDYMSERGLDYGDMTDRLASFIQEQGLADTLRAWLPRNEAQIEEG